MLELIEPQLSVFDYEGIDFKLHFYRYDGSLGHAVCHLDVITDQALVENTDRQAGVLEASRWSMQMGLVDPHEEAGQMSVIFESASMMKAPGEALCGFRLQMDAEIALTILDSFQRTGNLLLHIFMKDMRGEDFEIEVPIHPTDAMLFDPHGPLRERIQCDYARRN